jgi:hypothetical protein
MKWTDKFSRDMCAAVEAARSKDTASFLLGVFHGALFQRGTGPLPDRETLQHVAESPDLERGLAFIDDWMHGPGGKTCAEPRP